MAFGLLTALNCTKFVFGWASLQCSPDPLAGLRGPTSKRGERKGAEEREGGDAPLSRPTFLNVPTLLVTTKASFLLIGNYVHASYLILCLSQLKMIPEVIQELFHLFE